MCAKHFSSNFRSYERHEVLITILWSYTHHLTLLHLSSWQKHALFFKGLHEYLRLSHFAFKIIT